MGLQTCMLPDAVVLRGLFFANGKTTKKQGKNGSLIKTVQGSGDQLLDHPLCSQPGSLPGVILLSLNSYNFWRQMGLW